MRAIFWLVALAVTPAGIVACGDADVEANSTPALTGFATAYEAAERVRLWLV